jgi:hypothetical protein
MTMPVVEARRCTRTGSAAAQPGDLVGGERVRSGAQQLAGVQVEEHQRGRFDPDPDVPPGQDLRRRDRLPGQADPPVAGDAPLDLDRRECLTGAVRAA